MTEQILEFGTQNQKQIQKKREIQRPVPALKDFDIYYGPGVVELLNSDYLIEGTLLTDEIVLSKISDSIRRYNRGHTQFHEYIVLNGNNRNHGKIGGPVDPNHVLAIYHSGKVLGVRFLGDRDRSKVPRLFYDGIMARITYFKDPEGR